MVAYTHTQLWLLLGVALLAGAGLAVGSWRRGHHDLATRVERFDAGTAAGGAHGSAPGAVADGGPPILPSTADQPPIDQPLAAARPAGHAAAPPRSAAPGAGGAPGRVGARPVSKRQPFEGPLDLNRAALEDLVRLPGVGPALARRILSARATAGRFHSLDDLARVPGMGPMKLARLRELASVPRAASAP